MVARKHNIWQFCEQINLSRGRLNYVSIFASWRGQLFLLGNFENLEHPQLLVIANNVVKHAFALVWIARWHSWSVISVTVRARKVNTVECVNKWLKFTFGVKFLKLNFNGSVAI